MSTVDDVGKLAIKPPRAGGSNELEGGSEVLCWATVWPLKTDRKSRRRRLALTELPSNMLGMDLRWVSSHVTNLNEWIEWETAAFERAGLSREETVKKLDMLAYSQLDTTDAPSGYVPGQLFAIPDHGSSWYRCREWNNDRKVTRRVGLSFRSALEKTITMRDGSLELQAQQPALVPNFWTAFSQHNRVGKAFWTFYGAFETLLENLVQRAIAQNVQVVELRVGYHTFDCHGVAKTMDVGASCIYDFRDDGSIIFLPTHSLWSRLEERARQARAKGVHLKFIVQMAKREMPTRNYKGSQQIQVVKSLVYRLNLLRDWFQKHPDLVCGIDLAGEETDSNMLEDFAELLMELNASEALPLYLHAGETWSPYNMNSMYALSMGSKRIGHGLSASRMGDSLLKKAIQDGVAFEVCPISNQILGYTPDIRNHPALHMLQKGVAITIGVDDPLIQGYHSKYLFAYDWLSIFLAWPIDLSVLKQIALTGIEYSSLHVEATRGASVLKDEVIEEFASRWTDWVDASLKKLSYMDIESSEFVGAWRGRLEASVSAARNGLCRTGTTNAPRNPEWEHIDYEQMTEFSDEEIDYAGDAE
eukprot:GFYU01011478.1.p1 GENE.GFYU01011478.1~~GFYU01011478.1.p1  ORF type:complete len:691 (-),score=154.53 GFYU01011478.1:51-1814(-)